MVSSLAGSPQAGGQAESLVFGREKPASGLQPVLAWETFDDSGRLTIVNEVKSDKSGSSGSFAW